MAKFITICYRASAHIPANLTSTLQKLCQKITPDNLALRPPLMLEEAGYAMAIINPDSLHHTHDLSACIGVMTSKRDDWYIPEGGVPDGNYAIIRADDSTVELVTDMVGTRTIWYYFDEEKLIASSSQRAIISLIGSYDPNPDTIPWFLGCGFHGYQMGWDKRVKWVSNNHSSIILDRNSWTIQEKNNPIHFSPIEVPNKNYFKYFKERLTQICQGMELDYSKNAVSISGGFDSRLLLLLLKDKEKLRTLTWGGPNSRENPFSDADIAKKLSNKMGIENHFISIMNGDLSFEKIFERFLIVGEGRVDKIAGYMDGFQMWNQIREDNIEGVIRGELPVSQHPIPEKIEDLTSSVGLFYLDQFFTKEQIAEWGLEVQRLPKSLAKREEESFMEYQDRLIQQFRLPTYHGSLNDLKITALEIIQPLLLSEVVKLYRSLPDHGRANKSFIKKIVKELSPKVGFAMIDSIIKYEDLFKQPEIVAFMKQCLTQPSAESVLSPKLIQYILGNLIVAESAYNDSNQDSFKTFKKRVKKLVPDSILKLRKPKPVRLSANRLGFRACIIIKMAQFLHEDAKTFREGISQVKY